MGQNYFFLVPQRVVTLWLRVCSPMPTQSRLWASWAPRWYKSLFSAAFSEVEASWSRTTRHKRALGRAPILISPYNIHHNTHMGHYNTHTE